ncbi:hypothetical protein SanaruYs_20070 [Chryseotalea sanaruensis]|uniref:Outer membrane protein beta-barrel domain-containing protein n=1 Tax=Chryseotalea sanaruensis TaxID=2482724 RepID=A0A401UA25_9BACT|nr:hypothetical protein [Chryseotalea sanaruensis]GCC51778.1 hypothetical protein SanaruYs_20070 [Chryseotalea sanaruensis]
MKKYYSLSILLLLCTLTQAQDFGLSFSYFIPKNGYFSTPISPFSLRGVGVNFNNYISLETGASLYRMSGLMVKDIPLSTKEPIVGPNFTLFVPVQLVFALRGNGASFEIKGGGFGFLPFANKLNFGHLDKAIRTAENWQVANAEASFKSQPGYGWMAGAELTVNVTKQIGISLETNYLAGAAGFAMQGSYTGGNAALETKDFNYEDAKMDLTGLEFSVGVFMSSGGQAKAKPRRRR